MAASVTLPQKLKAIVSRKPRLPRLKLPQRLPFVVILTVPHVLQIMGIVSITGLIYYNNSEIAVQRMGTELQIEIGDRIKSSLDQSLGATHQVVNMNAVSRHLDPEDPDSLADLEGDFWTQLQANPSIQDIYVGFPNGHSLSVTQSIRGRMIAEIREATSQQKAYVLDDQGQRNGQLAMPKKPDPRQQSWYRAAERQSSALWTEIGVFNNRSLGITAARPVYNRDDQLQAVVAANVNLDQISDLLRRLNIGYSGHALIMETSGAIVATSAYEDPFELDQNNKPKRIFKSQLQHPLIREAAEYMIQKVKLENLGKIQRSQGFVFNFEGHKTFLQVLRYQDDRGIDWLVGVILPASDFMDQVNASQQMAWGLSLIALAIAIATCFVISRWVNGSILQLNQAAMAIAEERWDQELSIYNVGELGDLARAFHRMTQQIKNNITKLEFQNQELQRLDKLKDDFLANTSHELKTPLNGILGISESMLAGATGPVTEPQSQNLMLVLSSAKRLKDLVNDILDFSKLKHQAIVLDCKPIDIGPIVEVILSISSTTIGRKKLQLINAIPEGIPLVMADENRLQQIFYNLIGNAIKFTDSGSIEVAATRLRRQLYETQDFVAITVTDTGIGIPADRFEKIFTAFEQADHSDARKYGGTGLGLTITRQFVELHGGRIWVESRVGEGSKFTFTLPLHELEGDQRLERSPQLEAYAGTPLLPPIPMLTPRDLQRNGHNSCTIVVPQLPQGKTSGGQPPSCEPQPQTTSRSSSAPIVKILAVDDDPINLQVLKNYLSLENYTVVEAMSGEEALRALSHEKFDLILLDVMMPQMSGYEVCAQIRKKYPAYQLPVIMLTAKSRVDDLVTGFNCGANDYLTKPFAKDELLTRVKAHLSNAAYGRFVPLSFLEFLQKECIADIELGNHVSKEMTVMFSDIRGFTALSESMTPQENFDFVNAYLERISPNVRENNGFIVKYLGDGMMAVFPDSSDDALRGGISKLQAVHNYNLERAKRGYPALKIGVGIHYGPMMVGIVGESERMQGDAFSDDVNLAARLEGLTKFYGVSLVVSEHAIAQLRNPGAYDMRFLDLVQVKGRQRPLAIYEVITGEPTIIRDRKLRTQADFEQGINCYRSGDFKGARVALSRAWERDPDDSVLRLYLERINHLQKQGVPKDWDGIWRWREK